MLSRIPSAYRRTPAVANKIKCGDLTLLEDKRNGMIYFPDRMGSIYDWWVFLCRLDPLRWAGQTTHNPKGPNTKRRIPGPQDDPSMTAQIFDNRRYRWNHRSRHARTKRCCDADPAQFPKGAYFATKPCSRLQHSLSDNPALSSLDSLISSPVN